MSPSALSHLSRRSTPEADLSRRSPLEAKADQLDFLLALFRPFLTKADAAFLLDDCAEEKILALIDEGKLRAINIATDTDTRRELRIYRYTVEHRLLSPTTAWGTISPELIIPHHRPTVLCRELADWLSCTERHVRNLNLSGPRDSHDTRHRIWRESAVEFLTARELQP
jgi:hypothetical protein